MSDQIKFLAFVRAEDMRGLYEGALAVVMPTYFGPKNLPPLEAWSLGKPLIYSSHLAEQTGDAALLINPDDANELADLMLICNDPMGRNRLVEASKRRLPLIAQQGWESETKLTSKLEIFARTRTCWK